MATPEEMAQAMRNNIPDKTGKSLAQWFSLIAAEGLQKHGQIVKMLKTDHGMTHGFANLVAADYLNKDQAIQSDDELINQQYSAAKAHLRVIYDTLLERLSELPAMAVAAKKSYVSLRHNKQFAIIQPSTKTRVDVGINLKDSPTTTRLEASGSFNAMVTHRVKVLDVSDIDDELIGWLKTAYDKN